LWAHQQYGVSPDIMVIAKPLGGGLPIGAILATDAVAEHIRPGDHGSTFAGSPLVCAVASVVFKRLSNPLTLAHVQQMGDYLHNRLREVQAENGRIKDVRGRGLMLGAAIDGSVASVRNAAQDMGLLVVGAGDDVIRFVPPLIVQKHEIDEAVSIFRHALEAF
jgi:acetylornithine/N-succinyldiaminopimelate aminotransferase